jgi:hypothetical protein
VRELARQVGDGAEAAVLTGTHFEVKFEKSRDLFGEAAEPFDVRLDVNGTWIRSAIKDSLFEEAAEL